MEWVLTLRPAPAPLSNIKGAANNTGIDLSALLIDNCLLGLHDRGLPLVVDPNDLVTELKFPSCARRRQLLVDSDFALPVDDSFGVEAGYAWDGRAF